MEKREYLLNIIHSHLGSIGGVDGIELSNQDYVNSKIVDIIGNLAKVNSPHSIAAIYEAITDVMKQLKKDYGIYD